MKGLTAVLLEAAATAEAAGESEWFWEHVGKTVGDADQELLEHLVSSTAIHRDRRRKEMEAAIQLLEILGVDPVMTRATVESLRSVDPNSVP